MDFAIKKFATKHIATKKIAIYTFAINEKMTKKFVTHISANNIFTIKI